MVAPKPQDVLQLAQEITQLEAQLAAARRKWDVLFGVVAPEKKTHIRREDGLTARVQAHVERYSGIEHSISQVAEGVGEPDLPVGRVLYRLAATGKIASPSRGRYKALEKEVPSEEKTS